MDRNSIHSCADIVARLLDDDKQWGYNELKEASGLSDRDLNAAIGWLAREDKLQFMTDEKAGRDFVYLTLNHYIG